MNEIGIDRLKASAHRNRASRGIFYGNRASACSRLLRLFWRHSHAIHQNLLPRCFLLKKQRPRKPLRFQGPFYILYCNIVSQAALITAMIKHTFTAYDTPGSISRSHLHFYNMTLLFLLPQNTSYRILNKFCCSLMEENSTRIYEPRDHDSDFRLLIC